MDSRARITITDVLWWLVALIAISTFHPVVTSFFGDISGPTGVILYAMFPLALIILLAFIVTKARVGRVQ